MNLEELAVDSLAAARLTRLVTQDTITETLRKRFVGWVLDRADRGAFPSVPSWTTRLLGQGQLPPSDIEDVFEEWEKQESGDVPKLAVLLTCPWCVGVYVAVGVIAARAVAPRTWGRAARVLAVAQLAGVIDTH